MITLQKLIMEALIKDRVTCTIAPDDYNLTLSDTSRACGSAFKLGAEKWVGKTDTLLKMTHWIPQPPSNHASKVGPWRYVHQGGSVRESQPCSYTFKLQQEKLKTMMEWRTHKWTNWTQLVQTKTMINKTKECINQFVGMSALQTEAFIHSRNQACLMFCSQHNTRLEYLCEWNQWST